MLAVAIAASLVVGCAFLDVGQQQELGRQVIRLRGTASVDGPLQGTLVIVLLRASDESGAQSEIVDHYVVERSGAHYQFLTTEPGRYEIAAFNDVNSDLVYERDEPVLVPSAATTFNVVRGQEIDEIELVIDPTARANPEQAIDILAVQARSVDDQYKITLGQLQSVGEVTDLSDPRFAEDVGSKGLWAPYDFMFDVGGGVFFLEPFDPDRIPVLFVHGILGFPAQFAPLVDSLDRTRFQPWVYLYPSGAKLKNVAANLSQILVQLESRHDFEHLALVAHSMGGLVTRAALLHYYDETAKDYERVFITISTPWDGQASAAMAERVKDPVYSWIDIAPGSPFLDSLFYQSPGEVRRLLPPHMTPHLVFSFKGRSGARLVEGIFDKTADEANDTVVTVASELRIEAQQEARSVRGVDATHTGIFKSEETAEHLNSLLGHYADEL